MEERFFKSLTKGCKMIGNSKKQVSLKIKMLT